MERAEGLLLCNGDVAIWPGEGVLRSHIATSRGLQLGRLSWASNRPNVRRPQSGG